MRISDLETRATALGESTAYFAVDQASSNVTNKIDYNALAKAIVEQYVGSTIGGSAQSVKAAVDKAHNLKLSRPIDASQNPYDGTDGQFLRSNGDGTTRWDSGADEAEISAAVTEWLEENVSGGETIAVDKSLTVTDAAADAKVVGDEITTLKADLSYTNESLEDSFDKLAILKKPLIHTLNPGFISNSGGITSPGSSTKEVYTSLIPISEGETIRYKFLWGTDDEKWMAIAKYNSEKEFIARSVVINGATDRSYESNITQSDNVAYLAFTYRTYGDANFSAFTDWDELNDKFAEVAEDIREENSVILDDITKNVKYQDYVDGYIKTNTSTVDVTNVLTDANYKCIVVPCNSGDIFSIKGKSGPSEVRNLWTFVDSEGTKLSSSRVAHYTEYTIIKAPDNAAYLASDVDITQPYGLYSGRLLVNRVSTLESEIGTLAPTGLNNPLLKPCAPRVAMHRGFSTQAPENTIPAFELAGQAGAWAIETDIYETTDGYFILSHDNDVSRMTDGTGKITEMTYAQTQEFTIDAGSNIEQYPNLKMPTLQEYLAICRRYGCVAFTEIKGITHYDALVSEIRKAGMEGSVVFLFYYSLNEVNNVRANTRVPIALLGSTNTDVTALIDNAANSIDTWVNLRSLTITAEVLKYAHSKNIPVAGWTYNSATGAENDFRIGLDIATANGFAKLPQA